MTIQISVKNFSPFKEEAKSPLIHLIIKKSSNLRMVIL